MMYDVRCTMYDVRCMMYDVMYTYVQMKVRESRMANISVKKQPAIAVTFAHQTPLTHTSASLPSSHIISQLIRVKKRKRHIKRKSSKRKQHSSPTLSNNDHTSNKKRKHTHTHTKHTLHTYTHTHTHTHTHTSTHTSPNNSNPSITGNKRSSQSNSTAKGPLTEGISNVKCSTGSNDTTSLGLLGNAYLSDSSSDDE